MMVWLVLLFVWGSREGTEGHCFALVYGAPRSHLTFDHCASTSSSVEIADRGGSKLSDVTLPHQEGRNLLPKIQTFPADKYNIHRRTNPLWHPEQMEEGRTNFWNWTLSKNSPISHLFKFLKVAHSAIGNKPPWADRWSDQTSIWVILMEQYFFSFSSLCISFGGFPVGGAQN